MYSLARGPAHCYRPNPISGRADFSPDALRHLAPLARLRLDDADLGGPQRDVAASLTHFEALSASEAVEAPHASVAPRPDVPAAARADLLANVLHRDDDGRIKAGRSA